MNNRSMLVGLIVVIIVVIGYLLFFRGRAPKTQNTQNYYPAPTQQNVSPNANQPSPSGTLQPNTPANLQDQGAGTLPPNAAVNPSDQPAGQAAVASDRSITDVNIKNFAFSPNNVTIKTGQTVRWTNQDSAPHTVTSDDGKFDSGQLANGKSFTFAFTVPGTYTYHCGNHPNMKGTITVQ